MDQSQTHSDDGQTRAPVLIGVVVLLLCIAISMVGLRILSRMRIKELGLDDLSAVIALMCIIGCGISMASMTHYGLGRHEWTISEERFVLYKRCFWISILFYMMSLVFLKLTFLFHYYRLMSVSNVRYVFLAAIALVVAWAISQAIMAFVQCIPLQGVWDHRIHAKCIPNTVTLWYFNGVFNIVTDVAILLLPIPIVWKLELPRSQKILLTCIFGLGFFTVAVSILRMQWLTPSPDVSWWNVTPACWSLAELTSALSCACLPTFRPLITGVQRFFAGGSKGDSVERLQMEFGEPDSESNFTVVEVVSPAKRR